MKREFIKKGIKSKPIKIIQPNRYITYNEREPNTIKED